jgi:hypothetical protein
VLNEPIQQGNNQSINSYHIKMILIFSYCNEETHSDKSMSQGQVVSLTNRPEELSKEADLTEWSIQALHEQSQVFKNSIFKQIENGDREIFLTK